MKIWKQTHSQNQIQPTEKPGWWSPNPTGSTRLPMAEWPEEADLDQTPSTARLVVAFPTADKRIPLVRAFRNCGCEVYEVCDGNEMIEFLGEMLLQNPGKPGPDLIVADMDLPGRQGSMLLSDLRAAGWNTPFILTGSGGNNDTWTQAMNCGRVVIFEPEFDVDDLVTAAYFLLDHARVDRAVYPSENPAA